MENKVRTEISKILYDKLIYLGTNRSRTPLQVVGDWENLAKKEPEKSKEILNLLDELDKISKERAPSENVSSRSNWKSFRVLVLIDTLILKYLKWPEMSTRTSEILGLEPDAVTILLGKIIDHFGSLVLPGNLKINLNNREETQAVLEQYLRDLNSETLN
jgi:hypothetical protein